MFRACGLRSIIRTSAMLASCLGSLCFETASGNAAEFRLRDECRSRGPVVVLADLAEIFSSDPKEAEALSALEMFPSPPGSRKRFVRLREIQDLLALRGVNLAKHRFSGYGRVTVLGCGEQAAEQPRRRLSSSAARQAERRVREAVLQYLQDRAAAHRSWSLEFQIGESQARTVSGPGRAISISGGSSPWTGPQRFQVTVDSAEGPLRFPLDARVSVPPAAVVAARPLARGTMIRAGDVELRHAAVADVQTAGIRSIEEVIGRETTRPISAGKIITADLLRQQILVRRGEVVTVCSRSPGIRVRTMARARDDGSMGDLVAVESLSDRSTYFARVSKLREVEVYARSVKAPR